jgi:hypothetical protein
VIIKQLPSFPDHLLEVSDPAAIIGKSYFPDFLIIGPQRTGTTWLSECLRRHPNIFISSPKELYFFNLLKLKDHPFYQSSDLNWYVKYFVDSHEEFEQKNRMMLKRYGEEYQPQVRGEATASYAAMDEELIPLIHAINPGIKVILLVRNPLERAWSHAKKDLARDMKRNWKDVSRDEFKRFFVNQYQLRCGRFSQIIRQWGQVIKKENFFIRTFETIKKNPTELLKTIYLFLGVQSSSKYLGHDLIKKKINITGPTRIPSYYRKFLQDLFAPEIEILKQRFGITF